MSSTDFVISNGILISYVGDAEKIVIPENVIKIGPEAFKNNQTLRVVTFHGNALKSIESGAFAYCSCLERVVLPEGLIQICNRAFDGCDALVYMLIPSSVMVIGEEAITTKNKRFFILGQTGSEAEKFANNQKYTFKTDADRLIGTLTPLCSA